MNRIKKAVIRLRAPFYRIGLRNRDFSILSNNCWGGVMSRDYGLPYNSPTCGLFFFAPDYIRFLSDLDTYLAAEIVPLAWEDSRYREELDRRYPEDRPVLGSLLDVEIVFVHYPTFREAKEKWDRRKARLCFDNLLVKFNDQNLFTPDLLDAFWALPFPNKLFFTADPALADRPEAVLFPEYRDAGYVVEDIKHSRRHIRLNRILNQLAKNN